MKKFMYSIFLFLLVQSCETQKKILYFQNIEDVISNNHSNYVSPKIQSGDLLSIIVSSYHMEAVLPFNLAVSATSTDPTMSNRGQQQVQNYLVDSRGLVNFPVLGEIKASGKTRQELAQELQEKIKKYVKEPIVTINILNFRYTVLGEVKNPGVFQSPNEKVSILEAIGSAKDLTMYGIRDSVMLIRTEDDKVQKYFINLKDASIIDSSYFYLRQNDVVYVQPSKIKTRESNVSPFNSLIISGISLSLALLTFLTR